MIDDHAVLHWQNYPAMTAPVYEQVEFAGEEPLVCTELAWCSTNPETRAVRWQAVTSARQESLLVSRYQRRIRTATAANANEYHSCASADAATDAADWR